MTERSIHEEMWTPVCGKVLEDFGTFGGQTFRRLFSKFLAILN